MKLTGAVQDNLLAAWCREGRQKVSAVTKSNRFLESLLGT
jgi:hypothetical protein